jgi:hypothetical protein
MRRRDAFTVVEVMVALGAVAGAAVGAVSGFTKYGVLGAIAGVPIGFVVGGFITLFLCVPLTLVLFVVMVTGAYLTGGRSGVRELFRDPRVPLASEPGDGGECDGVR